MCSATILVRSRTGLATRWRGVSRVYFSTWCSRSLTESHERRFTGRSRDASDRDCLTRPESTRPNHRKTRTTEPTAVESGCASTTFRSIFTANTPLRALMHLMMLFRLMPNPVAMNHFCDVAASRECRDVEGSGEGPPHARPIFLGSWARVQEPWLVCQSIGSNSLRLRRVVFDQRSLRMPPPSNSLAP